MARVSSVEPSKLFEHIRQGKPIMECIDSGDSVTQANHFGMTPLLYAVAYNQTNYVEELLQKGSVITHQDKRGFSVLHIAAQKDLKNMFTLLMTRGADPKLKTKASELAYQVAEGKEKKMQYADMMNETYVSRFGETVEESLQIMAAQQAAGAAAQPSK
jgi:hypothetical protein